MALTIVLGVKDHMTLRATRQYVDVLSPGAGKARVTRQCIDVLVDATTEAASNDLGLTDSATLNGIFGRGVNSAMALADTLDVRGPIYFQVHHVLHLDELVTERVSPIHLFAADVLVFADQAGRHVPVIADNVLAFTQSGQRRKTGIAQSVLAFAQTVSVGKGKVVSSVLAFAQQVVVAATLRRNITDALGLVQSGAYQFDSPCMLRMLRQYWPFVGFGDSIPAPPVVLAPTLGVTTFTLTYPFVSPTLTVVLRNPEYANKDDLSFNRVNRQTRGGTLVVFVDQTWPKTQKLAVEIRWLKPAQVTDLLELFTSSLGKEVGLLDHENRLWRGIIINPDTPVANPGRDDYTVSFEFEGELA